MKGENLVLRTAGKEYDGHRPEGHPLEHLQKTPFQPAVRQYKKKSQPSPGQLLCSINNSQTPSGRSNASISSSTVQSSAEARLVCQMV